MELLMIQHIFTAGYFFFWGGSDISALGSQIWVDWNYIKFGG